MLQNLIQYPCSYRKTSFTTPKTSSILLDPLFDMDLGSNCKFVGWHDPEMCQRSLEIIPGLLRSKNELEVERNKLQAKVKATEEGARQMNKY
ncbi:hypothetical protein R6Q59_032349 [Mikania micrantha]